MRTMLGWLSPAIVRPSRSKRSRKLGSCPTVGGKILIATGRLNCGWSDRKTIAMPPSPSFSIKVYLPSLRPIRSLMAFSLSASAGLPAHHADLGERGGLEEAAPSRPPRQTAPVDHYSDLRMTRLSNSTFAPPLS